MSLKVVTRIPYGNARDITIDESGDVPVVSFSPDPHLNSECLWFCFRLLETDPSAPADGNIKLVLKYFDTLRGGDDPSKCLLVYRPPDQGWFRTKPGRLETAPDGQTHAAWTINRPQPAMDVALCFPYGREELQHLLSKSKGYWQSDAIGLSQGGRALIRLSNDYGGSNDRHAGLYLMARQHPGETPGSWVLDGMLQEFSRAKKNPYIVWAVPFANVDGIARGDYGRGSPATDVNRGWGEPPGRRENLVLAKDILRWRERCRPTLVVDFHAPGACEAAGIACVLPDKSLAPELHKEATKWANVIKDSLTDEYAAPEFKRPAEPSPAAAGTASSFCSGLGICSLTMEIPYSTAGKTVLSQKRYRDVGKRIADALVKRPA